MSKLPAHIVKAIKCGPVPKVRDWRNIDQDKWTRAERVMGFIERYCKTPDGAKVGEPIELALFQEVLIYSIYDNPAGTRRAYLGIARKNGKSALLSALLVCHICGPEAKQNQQTISGALSREQASIIHALASKMINLNPVLSELCRVIPSSKRILGLKKGVEFKSLSADGSRNQGLSVGFGVIDEIGQVKGPTSDFVDAILTSSGAHKEPLIICISTASPSDADLFSILIDDSIRSQDSKIVCHVYSADDGCEVDDEQGWQDANPALGIFRSREDLVEQAKQAKRMPSSEASFRNLCLNQRISLQSLWCSPSVWKENSALPDYSLLKTGEVHLGLDLSTLNDLTACVATVKDDDGFVHVYPYVFTPSQGLEERASKSRAPYPQWVRDEKMIAITGKVLDYELICQFLAREFEDCNIVSVNFDRWRIKDFAKEAERAGFAGNAQWVEVGQGFQSMSPRLEKTMELLLHGNIKHGGHPLMNFGIGNAIAVSDTAGNMKLGKDRSTQKIDQIVAFVMSVYSCAVNLEAEIDIDTLIF